MYRGADGSVYDGGWLRGQRSGEGADSSGDGLTTYKGSFQRDARHGHGVLRTRESPSDTLENVYDGEWRDGKRHGSGSLSLMTGESYTGQWQNDRRNGRGLSIKPDGEVRQGKCPFHARVCAWGLMAEDAHVPAQCVKRCFCSQRYDGKFIGDVKCGHGTHTMPWHESYTGDFVGGERHGHGTCTYAERTSKNSCHHACAVLPLHMQSQRSPLLMYWTRYRYADGSCYKGEWIKGQRHGRGRLATKGGAGPGEVYDGTWSNGQRHGSGTHTSAAGDVYVGSYHADKRAGQGRITFVDGECSDVMRRTHLPRTLTTSLTTYSYHVRLWYNGSLSVLSMRTIRVLIPSRLFTVQAPSMKVSSTTVPRMAKGRSSWPVASTTMASGRQATGVAVALATTPTEMCTTARSAHALPATELVYRLPCASHMQKLGSSTSWQHNTPCILHATSLTCFHVRAVCPFMLRAVVWLDALRSREDAVPFRAAYDQ